MADLDPLWVAGAISATAVWVGVGLAARKLIHTADMRRAARRARQ